MLKISLQKLALSLMVGAFCFASLAVNADSNPFNSLSQHGSMLKRPLPMQNIANAETAKTDTSSMTITEIIEADPSLSTLSQALEAADVNSVLKEDGPYTLFAPNDAAFAKMSPNALDDLMSPENKDKLTSLLTYHVFPGKISSDEIKTMTIKSVNGDPLDIKADGEEITINNAHIVKKDIEASNGVIHIIDTVLKP